MALEGDENIEVDAETEQILRPNDLITLEVAWERLNLRLDEKDVVHSVLCG